MLTVLTHDIILMTSLRTELVFRPSLNVPYNTHYFSNNSKRFKPPANDTNESFKVLGAQRNTAIKSMGQGGIQW